MPTLTADTLASLGMRREHLVPVPDPNGYRLEVRCLCGVVFERRVTPTDAAVELALFARCN
jgi:hypothetical protein